jgi:hypothetical protein
MDLRLIASSQDFGGGKVIVLTLDFLQEQDIGLIVMEPFNHIAQTGIDRIDVPGGDPQGLDGKAGATAAGGRSIGVFYLKR